MNYYLGHVVSFVTSSLADFQPEVDQFDHASDDARVIDDDDDEDGDSISGSSGRVTPPEVASSLGGVRVDSAATLTSEIDVIGSRESAENGDEIRHSLGYSESYFIQWQNMGFWLQRCEIVVYK